MLHDVAAVGEVGLLAWHVANQKHQRKASQAFESLYTLYLCFTAAVAEAMASCSRIHTASGRAASVGACLSS